MAKLLLGPQRNPSDDPEEFRLTLIEHLEELRNRLIRVIVAIAIGFAIGWFTEGSVYTLIETSAAVAVRSAMPKGTHYVAAFHNMTDPFMLTMRLAFLIGAVLVFPYIIVQIWGFVAPGLKPAERRPFKQLAPYSVLLFFVGAAFCWMIMPKAWVWFTGYMGNYPGADLYQEPGMMTFFTLKMIGAFGIGFQLPLIVYGLGMAGLLTGQTLMDNWRQAATGIFVAAMIITPSNDLFSMLMMAIPLVILFGISVFAVRLLEKRREKLANRARYPIE